MGGGRGLGAPIPKFDIFQPKCFAEEINFEVFFTNSSFGGTQSGLIPLPSFIITLNALESVLSENSNNTVKILQIDFVIDT